MRKHKYSDNCMCDKCRETWEKALFKAVGIKEKTIKKVKKEMSNER